MHACILYRVGAIKQHASMAERSKAMVSSTIVFVLVGSNPTRRNLLLLGQRKAGDASSLFYRIHRYSHGDSVSVSFFLHNNSSS